MKKCTRICENPRSNYYSTYSRHRCVRALSLHAFLRPGEIKFTDFRRSRDHGRDHRFRKIHANAQCSSFGGRTRHASRSRFAPYFPRARPRNSPAFSLQFPPRFPLSKLDLSSPLQHRIEPRFRVVYDPRRVPNPLRPRQRRRIRGWNCCAHGKPRKRVIVSE